VFVVQSKTNKPVQFELAENTRETVTNWIKSPEIYRKTGNLRAVQLLLSHTKVDSTVRYLGVELEDALSISERTDI
jgi:hypothetical protein